MASPDVPAEGQTRIIEVNVPLGDRIFRDRLEWAVGQPHNLPERYAAGVCSELGLDWQDAKTIVDAMRQQIASLPQQQEAPHQGPCMHKRRHVEEASLFASYPRLDLK
ncbi:g8305 [Coccomyxa elongata]